MAFITVFRFANSLVDVNCSYASSLVLNTWEWAETKSRPTSTQSTGKANDFIARDLVYIYTALHRLGSSRISVPWSLVFCVNVLHLTSLWRYALKYRKINNSRQFWKPSVCCAIYLSFMHSICTSINSHFVYCKLQACRNLSMHCSRC